MMLWLLFWLIYSFLKPQFFLATTILLPSLFLFFKSKISNRNYPNTKPS